MSGINRVVAVSMMIENQADCLEWEAIKKKRKGKMRVRPRSMAIVDGID
jgi:hypothetical protein